MEIKKELLPPDRLKAKPADENALGFGSIFSDHMFVMDYKAPQGWHDARIVPYGPFPLDPAAAVLHYAQEVFEGLKAYRGKDGGIYLFRPMSNIERMSRSCERVCMPVPPPDVFMDALVELVKIEKDWVPSTPGTSMYIRPTMVATEPFLGVRPAQQYLFFIIVGPVGAYYPEGFAPVKIYVEEEFIRAAPGGLGQAKTGANYVASLQAAEKAHAKGFTQVLWLNACDKQTIEEVGTMNMFFVMDDEVVTAPLGGTILPGVTRDAVLELVQNYGYKAVERRVTIDEIIEAQKSGRLKEAFGSGTAAVISPVGSITYTGVDYKVGGGGTGEISKRLFDELTAIQYGDQPDERGWVVKVA